MVKLREYQEEAIEAIRQGFLENSRQYVEMPTGSGKTVTFLSYAREFERVMVIVPSRQLLRQVYSSAMAFYDPSEVSRQGDKRRDTPSRLHVCVVNSLLTKYVEKMQAHEFDLVVIDEAHHSQAPSYKRFIQSRNPEQKFLGVTATPDRSDRQLLEHVLGKCTFRLTLHEMIEAGHLCDIEGMCIKTKISMEDVDNHNGDFSINQLYSKLATEDRNNMILDVYKQELKDRKTLVFAINVQHSKSLVKLFRQHHISAAHIDGLMKTSSKQAVLEGFRNGSIQVLCNCQILTEGFDEPSIDGIILSRPTSSPALFTQMIGRGVRNFPGKKNCKIVDIVDMHSRLAGFNDIISTAKIPGIQRFRGIRELREHVAKEEYRLLEFKIERADLINRSVVASNDPTPCMYEYLETEGIVHFSPSFEEAAFMIWFNELKKEMRNA